MLSQAERQLQDGVARQDRAALEALVGLEFSLSSPRMNLGRDEWIATATGPYKAESFEFLELHVQPFGEVAVVDHLLRGHASMGGTMAHPVWHGTDIWVKRDGGWQIVKRCAYPLPHEGTSAE